MLASRGQENLVHARPAAGKVLNPKTPSAIQTPRNGNRAPLGAKTTNAKAQTVLKDAKNAKFQVFKTPAPAQQQIKQERNENKPSTARRSGRSKITIAPAGPVQTNVLTEDLEDDEPEFGYAPPPIAELPDHPIEWGYDQSFPQFRPENMFRGYGEIFDSSPKDEHGFSIRLKKEDEEYQEWLKQQELECDERMRNLKMPELLSEEEILAPVKKIRASRPNTSQARSAASALSGMKVPSVAMQHTASSKLKMNKPVSSKPVIKKAERSLAPSSRPMSVSKNTIGFPKARNTPSILPQHNQPLYETDDVDTLADDLSDFEFSPVDNDDDVFQLPMPE